MVQKKENFWLRPQEGYLDGMESNLEFRFGRMKVPLLRNEVGSRFADSPDYANCLLNINKNYCMWTQKNSNSLP